MALFHTATGGLRCRTVTSSEPSWSQTRPEPPLFGGCFESVSLAMAWSRKRIGSNPDGLPDVRLEGAWPSIVDLETFDQVQAVLTSRAPRVTHPRVVHSEYMLSGMIRCPGCGTAMIGHAVKSGKFVYYMCGNGRRRGRGVCASPLLPKARIEGFVIDWIKRYILTEENLAEVVRLTNEELTQVSSAERERVKVLESQVREADDRLAKL